MTHGESWVFFTARLPVPLPTRQLSTCTLAVRVTVILLAPPARPD